MEDNLFAYTTRLTGFTVLILHINELYVIVSKRLKIVEEVMGMKQCTSNNGSIRKACVMYTTHKEIHTDEVKI